MTLNSVKTETQIKKFKNVNGFYINISSAMLDFSNQNKCFLFLWEFKLVLCVASKSHNSH